MSDYFGLSDVAQLTRFPLLRANGVSRYLSSSPDRLDITQTRAACGDGRPCWRRANAITYQRCDQRATSRRRQRLSFEGAPRRRACVSVGDQARWRVRGLRVSVTRQGEGEDEVRACEKRVAALFLECIRREEDGG